MSVFVAFYVCSMLLWSFNEFRIKFWANPTTTFLLPGYFGESIVVVVGGIMFSLLDKYPVFPVISFFPLGDFELLDSFSISSSR